MPIHSRSMLMLLLVLAIAGLGYANVRLANTDVDIAPIVASGTAAGAGASSRASDRTLGSPLRSIADFPQTTARPIFFADRKMPEKPKPKPAAVVEVPPPPALPPPEPLQLVGILGADANRRALLQSKTDPQGAWLRIGDEYRGWKLQEITSDNVIVEARGQRSELRLYTFGGAGTSKQ